MKFYAICKANRKSTKQRSTKHTYKSKDRVTRTPLKTGGELVCSGRVNEYTTIYITEKKKHCKSYKTASQQNIRHDGYKSKFILHEM